MLVPEGVESALRRILDSRAGRDWIFPVRKNAFFRKLLFLGEGLLLPGIITHYLVRKLQIERAVEGAISGGCRRVVVLGAGYDTLAWRLHRKHPDVRFVELDHPATQQSKKKNLTAGSNLDFQPLDLMSDLPSSLLNEPELPTVVVIEGVTMYLPPKRVEELMRDVASVMGPEGRVVWTFMERDKKGVIGFRGESSLISRWLKRRSEPFLWGISRDELSHFLKPCGLQQNELVDHEQLRRDCLLPRGLNALPLAEGELIGIAISF